MISKIKKIFKDCIVNKCLIDIEQNFKIIAAVSGGADSVCMLLLLKDLFGADKVICAHFNHKIRGEEADRDELFTKSLAAKIGVQFECAEADVPAYAKSEGIGLEAAARKLRYDFLNLTATKYTGEIFIAVAHNKSDKVETILMNIIRGCSLRGYAGIEYKNGSVIRPLLDISKSEILTFCQENNIEYCVDSTNEDTEYTRNRIRHILLPKLKETNPSFEESLLRQSEIFTCEDEFLNIEADKFPVDDGIDLSKFSSLHKAIARRVIYKYIGNIKGSRNDISYTDIENALSICTSGKTGSRCHISGSLEGVVSYGKFFIREKMKDLSFEYEISLGETIEIKEAGVKIMLTSTGGNFKISAGDKVVIRSRRDGDVFYPVGMNGSKKVKDYLIDKKIPADKRMKIPILTVNEKIASIVGMRNDRRFFCPEGTCNLIIEKI